MQIVKECNKQHCPCSRAGILRCFSCKAPLWWLKAAINLTNGFISLNIPGNLTFLNMKLLHVTVYLLFKLICEKFKHLVWFAFFFTWSGIGFILIYCNKCIAGTAKQRHLMPCLLNINANLTWETKQCTYTSTFLRVQHKVDDKFFSWRNLSLSHDW